ncbi:MAG: S1/P1 nuclease [Alistipes sp.]|nr:S1/P1 nuclease [Alistipes sp.]
MKKISIITIILVLFVTTRAMAWGGPGHSIIGYIAENHLTPAAKEKCHHYIRHTLAYEASWMDHWRYCKGFNGTAHWHIGYAYPERQYTGDFRDQFIKQESVRKSAAYRINEFHNELRSSYKEMPDSIVANKIRFLIHMLGDMHCPAHVAIPVEDKPTYDETTVYNRYRLYRNGKKSSYHNMWDTVTSLLFPKRMIPEWIEEVDTYNDKQREKICQGDANDWLAATTKDVFRSYKQIPRDTDIAKLSDKQREQLTNLTYKQMAYAGYRLAYILNDIFKE